MRSKLNYNHIIPVLLSFFVMSFLDLVGIDVSMNSNLGTYLVEKVGIDPEISKYGKSMYFFAKMIGTFSGAVVLTKVSKRKFLLISVILANVSVIGLLFITNEVWVWIFIFLVSLGVANIFPLIFGITINRLPERSNEISGLMMMAICGGAIVPVIVGLAMSLWLPLGVITLFMATLYFFIVVLFSSQDKNIQLD